MERIKELKGKKIAILGLGASQIDFVIGLENSKEWDEVWVINSALALRSPACTASASTLSCSCSAML